MPAWSKSRQSKDATLKLTPDERGKTLVRRAIDPNNPEFLTRVLTGTLSQARLESAHRYLTTLHKVSESLAQAASVEALYDAVLRRRARRDQGRPRGGPAARSAVVDRRMLRRADRRRADAQRRADRRAR